MASIENEDKINGLVFRLIKTIDLLNNTLYGGETYDKLFNSYFNKVKKIERLGQNRETTKSMLKELGAVITNY